ncbi:MAG: hypothetical protein L0H84_21730 [Pseudonocardia sp.]|nr:hypothetical protein [Pseudonocardia sp.]
MTISTASTPARSEARLPVPALVAIAATGPLAVAVLRAVLPTFTVDDAATVATKVAAAPGAQAAVLWLTYLALLTLPLGVLVVSRAAIAARPVLGTVAAVVAWLGFTSLFMIVAVDQVALAGREIGTGPTAAMMDVVAGLSIVSVASTVFVAGHILATVLLGFALWRAVPWWAAVSLAISQPLHLVFAVIVPNRALDALAWCLTAVGFAVAATVRGPRLGSRSGQ